MPFIDFVTRDDRVSIYYTTNTIRKDTSDFDPDKPIVLMLHPLFLDSTSLVPQFEDPRLSSRYNLIAVDNRCSGMSVSRPSAQLDNWVNAADVANVLLSLGLPPVHIFAIQTISVCTALILAALFPELVASLTLVNTPPPTELEWVFETYGELLNLWCHPQDLDEYDHALLELTNYFLGNDATQELRDDLIAYWSVSYPPWKRSRIYQLFHCVLNRSPLNEELLRCISAPTLIIQSDKTEINPLKYAERLAHSLVNAEGRARVHTIKGSPDYLTIVPTCASVVNRVFAEFLNRQPKAHFPYSPKITTFAERRARMGRALAKLASLTNDNAIASRDPSSAVSFSCVSPEILQSQTDVLRRQMLDERLAFSPLGFDGRPSRRFSERYSDHWFSADGDENQKSSVRNRNLNKEDKIKALENLVTETEHKSRTHHRDGGFLSAQEPVSSEVARTGRLRRSTISKHIVEKATVGGSGSSGFAPTLISNTLHMSRLRF